tara:strand:- start:4191 stop:5498 length:1308 start_codon:yes stop_codon:yes gene_type:complete
MNFYWYLDVAENSFDTGQADPDTTPVLTTTPLPASFTIGPIEFAPDENINVMAFIRRIQDAFDSAYESGTAPRLYHIVARVRPIVSNDPLVAQARALKELAIEYKIYNDDDIRFSILFRSGEHGSAGGLAASQILIDGPPVAEVAVENDPNVRAIETPYCQLTSTITDKPPIPPDILFVPYVGVNNKVMIMFNSNAGEKSETPIILRDNDVTFVVEEYFSQHRMALTAEDIASLSLGTGQVEKLQYRNDDPIRKYELFRVNTKPTSYADFKGSHLTAAPIQAELGPDKFSTAVAFVDTVVPNQKYWYCARSLDVHNNISNPTYIFEVEMVDNRGQMFLKTRVFNFEPKKYAYNKSGRRFLAIAPRATQTFYDPSVSSPGTVGINEEPDPNILGTEQVKTNSSVWGKRFKIRVTSKKTGRKIDLNVTFKNDGVVIP